MNCKIGRISFVLFCLIGGLGAWGLAAQPDLNPFLIPEKGYRTQEDAIKGFFEGMANKDLVKSLQAWDVDEQANMDVAAFYKNLNAIPGNALFLPGSSEFNKNVNYVSILGRTVNAIDAFLWSLVSDKTGYTFKGSMPLGDNPDDQIKTIFGALGFDNLSSLKIIATGNTASYVDLVKSDRYLKNKKNALALYKASDDTEMLVLFGYSGKTYFVGLSLYEYGDSWKIHSLVAPIQNTELNLANPISSDEFNEAIGRKQ